MAVRLERCSSYLHWIDGSGRYRRGPINLCGIGGLRTLGRRRTLRHIPRDISSAITRERYARFLFVGSFSGSGRFLATPPEAPATTRGLRRRFRRLVFRHTLVRQLVLVIPLRL